MNKFINYLKENQTEIMMAAMGLASASTGSSLHRAYADLLRTRN